VKQWAGNFAPENFRSRCHPPTTGRILWWARGLCSLCPCSSGNCSTEVLFAQPATSQYSRTAFKL